MPKNWVGLQMGLFDQLAAKGGTQQMREVVQQTDRAVFTARLCEALYRFLEEGPCIHSKGPRIAALDPALGKAVEAPKSASLNGDEKYYGAIRAE